MSALETTVLRSIITNEKIMRKVMPFLKSAYFEGNHRVLFRQLVKYVTKYNRLPTQEAFKIEVDQNDSITDDRYAGIVELIPNIFVHEPVDEDWLLEKTEEWCQGRALHIAIMDSIQILDGKHETLNKAAIPDLLTDALAVGFDQSIGHDYFEDMESRFDFYHQDHERVAFDLDFFNRITGGGLFNKTLTICLAGCVHPETKVKIRYRKKL